MLGKQKYFKAKAKASNKFSVGGTICRRLLGGAMTRCAADTSLTTMPGRRKRRRMCFLCMRCFLATHAVQATVYSLHFCMALILGRNRTEIIEPRGLKECGQDGDSASGELLFQSYLYLRSHDSCHDSLSRYHYQRTDAWLNWAVF